MRKRKIILATPLVRINEIILSLSLFLSKGTPTHGYYKWTVDVRPETSELYIFVADDGNDAYSCNFVRVAVTIKSKLYGIRRTFVYDSPFEIVFQVCISLNICSLGTELTFIPCIKKICII